MCVKSRLVCSAGGSHVRVKARSPVAWIADYKSYYDPKYKKRGFSDGCKDIYGTFLRELDEGLIDKDEAEMKKEKREG